MERVLVSVVFADLSGFTELVNGTDEAAYLSFITEFRETIFSCISPLMGHNRVEYGFWGDEVKVLFMGPVQAQNALDALQCSRDMVARWDAAPSSEDRRRKGQNPLRFKVGVATGEVAVGRFAGARSPESEGLPLCAARSLSKWAQAGRSSRIYVDGATLNLLEPHTAHVRWVRVDDRDDTWEVE